MRDSHQNTFNIVLSEAFQESKGKQNQQENTAEEDFGWKSDI